jgi:hypothetical protein
MQLVAAVVVGPVVLLLNLEMHSVVAFRVPVELMCVPVGHVMEVPTPAAVVAAVETAVVVLRSLNIFPCAIKEQLQ